MKKFFAVNKRTLPDGNCPSSGKTSKIGTGNGDPRCLSTSNSGPIQSKEDNLVMLMNQAGMRMQELRNILHQESVLARRDPDTLKLQAFVRHYLRQIEVVDAILHCDRDPKITRREGYHLFAEDLQHQTSFDQNGSKFPFAASVTCANSGDGDDILKRDGKEKRDADPVSSSPAVCSEEVNHDDVNIPDSGLASLEAHDELDACALPLHSIKNVLSEDETGHRQPKQNLQNRDLHLQIDSTPISSKFLNSDDETCGKRKVQDYLKKYAEQQSNFESDSDQDIIDASLRACTKKSVLRRPKKMRGRLDQIFPLIPDSFGKPLMASTPTSSGFPEQDFVDAHRTNDMISRSSTDNLLAGGDIEDETPWKDRSKSKNESWYEFKERCSRTSLHSLSQQSTSQTRLSHQKSSFLIKDYVDGTKAPKAVTPPVKCVRFNLGPRERASDDTSCESSTDDDAPFEVDQFPCVKPAYRRPQRGHSGKQSNNERLYY